MGSINSPHHTIGIWFSKGVASIGEQGINSLSAFVLQIALLRLLGLEQFGAFSIAYSVLVLISGSVGSIAFEPLPIIGGRQRSEDLRHYVGQVARYTFIAGIFFAGLAVAILIGASALDIASTIPLLGASLALPFVLMFWVLRRGCYLLGRPGAGIAAGLLGAAVTFSLLGITVIYDALTTFTAFLVVGCAAVSSTGILIRTLNIPIFGPNAMPRRQLIDQHWYYGKWLLGTTIAFWFRTGALPLIASAFGGLEAAGATRAFYNLVVPLIQGVAALTAYTTPIVSRRYNEDGRTALVRYGVALTMVITAIAVVYGGALWLGGPWIIELLYDGHVTALANILPAFILIGVLHCLYQGAGVVLMAAGRTKAVFYAQVCAALLTVSAAMVGGYWYGFVGSIWAFIPGYVVLAGSLIRLSFRTAGRQPVPVFATK